jgi:HPt (histidine-containing phosphotransfer) domain-containing protein
MNDPASGSTDSSCVLDMRVIQDLRDLGGEDDPGLLLELIDMFLADAPTRMAEIDASLKNGDVKTLERAAHTLKSSCANIGAMGLSALCKQMEEHARKKAFEPIPSLLSASTKSLAEVAAALRNLPA